MDARARYRFALLALAALLPLTTLWWLVVDDLIAALRPVTVFLVSTLLPVRDLIPNGHGGWTARTSLEITAGRPGAGQQEATFTVDAVLLRRYLVAVPFFLALAAAPPWAPRLLRLLAIGLSALAGLFVLSAASLVFTLLAVLVNHQPNPADRDYFVPPPFTVEAESYGGVAFFLAGLAFYAASYVLPLLAPILLWATLNPVPRRALFAIGIPAVPTDYASR